MQNVNVKLTKDKVISYKQHLFLKKSLRQLGMSPQNNGYKLLIKVIVLVYQEDMITINLKSICNILALKSKILKSSSINSELKYSFYNINSKKLFANYEKIFGIEFDPKYFSLKTLISDFVDLLENMEV